VRADTEVIPEQAEAEDSLPDARFRPGPAAKPRDLIGGAKPGELDLFPFAMLLRAHLWRTLLLAFLGVVLAAVYAHTRKPRYAATATILIPQQNNGSAANLALQAATGLDLFGGGYEVYLDILHSRTVQDKLIAEFNLQAHYQVPNIESAEGMLFKRSFIFAGKEGLLIVVVQDEDPKLAADLANGYFTELSQLNARLGITAAGQLRHYYEGEMVKEKDALADAEVALEQSQQKTGVVEPQVQANVELGAEENTRAQLRARQIELQGLLQGATAQNPDVIRLQSEIAGLEGQLRAFQTSGGPGIGTPASQQPAQALDYIRKLRDVKFHEALLDMITRQVENARQQESKDISMIEVLDAARPTPFPVWPPSRDWMLIGAAAGLVLGLLLSVAEGVYATMMTNPINQRRMREFLRGKSLA
jgi:uncharacterized protein involved in exopolysaccharide biosynthesis